MSAAEATPAAKSDATTLIGTPRVAYIDVIRALAALAVVVTHVHQRWLGGALPHHPIVQAVVLHAMSLGHIGVDVFVVLSGYCLTLPLVRPGRLRGLRAWQFYQRRMWRILPAYYVSLAVIVALELIPHLQREMVASPLSGEALATHLTLTQTLFAGQDGTINGPYWSIALELQLYLMFPLVVLLAAKRSWQAAVMVSVALACAWAALGTTSALDGLADPNHLLPARLVQFCFGCLAACVSTRTPDRRAWKPLVSAGVCATLGAIVTDLNRSPLLQALLWGGLGAALLIAGTRVEEPTGGITSAVWRRGTHLGVRSFSFYLVHEPVIALLAPATRYFGLTEDLIFMILVDIPLTYLLASGLYRLAEVPGIERGRNLDIYTSSQA